MTISGDLERSELPPAEAARETTRLTLRDPALQAELEKVGYAIVPLLDGNELEAVRSACAALGPAPDDPKIAINWSFHSTSSYYKRTVKETFLRIARPALGRVLIDHDVYLTTFITKWPGPQSAFAPHQDPTLVDERFYRGVTVWMPLEDPDEGDGRDNGMLYVVPGSHRFSRALRLPDVDRFQFAEHERAIVERYGVVMPTKAGNALIFDNRLLHYSMPNETGEPRVVLSFGVRPAEGICVHLRDGGDGVLHLYEVPDDFYIDVVPAEQHLWEPPDPPIARLREVRRRWTPAQFEQLCTAAAPSVVPKLDDGTAGRWREPGAFCAFCGGTDGLDEGDRKGRNNAQLVCTACRLRMDSG